AQQPDTGEQDAREAAGRRADRKKAARRWTFVVGFCESVLLFVLLAAWWFGAQPGFSLATLFITVSALLFLILISVLRQKAPVGGNAVAKERENDRKGERNLTIF